MKSFLLLLLAGNGSRLYQDIGEKKQFTNINDKPLFLYSLISFLESKLFDKCVLVIAKEDEDIVVSYLKKFNISLENIILSYGGKTRNESVLNGLNTLIKLAKDEDKVFIHDAARPLIDVKTILEIYYKSLNLDGLTPIIKIDDSILSKENGIKYVNRDKYFKVATPQVFTYSRIIEAYKNYDNLSTDDFSKLLNRGYKVDTILISKRTFKVTTIEDMFLLKAYLNIEK